LQNKLECLSWQWLIFYASALPTNMPCTNALAYHAEALATQKKSFVALTPCEDVIKLVADNLAE
jgi:hypothetical protein